MRANPQYFRAYAHECSHNKTLCPDPEEPVCLEGEECGGGHDDEKDPYPTVKLYIPEGLNPQSGSTLVHTSEITGVTEANSLANLLRNEMPFLGEKMCLNDYQEFMAEMVNKVILLWDHALVPDWYKALSSHFFERLAFGYVHFDEELKLAKKRLKVKAPPKLILFLEDDTRIEYEGKFDFENVDKWMEIYAHEQKHRVHYRKPHSAHDHTHKFSDINKSDMPYEKKLHHFKEKAVKLGEHNRKAMEDAEAHRARAAEL
jgi:hypothetical protein